MPDQPFSSDALAALHRLAGPDETPAAEAREVAIARLRREVAREAQARPRPRPRLRASRALLLAPIAALALAGAGYAALNDASSPSAGIECHPAASLGSGGTVLADDGRRATEVCADAWRSGAVGATAAVPPLQSCVAPTGGGAIHVIPATDPRACENLGLVSAPMAGTGRDAKLFAAFAQDVVARFERSACVRPAEGEAIVRTALDAHGLSTWTIAKGAGAHGEGFSEARPCASLAFDSGRTKVTLVPDSPAGGS